MIICIRFDMTAETDSHRALFLSSQQTLFMCRKLEDMTLESQQASQALGSTEMSVRTLEHQLEEKTRECGVLSRQLQQSLDSAQQQVRRVSGCQSDWQ